MLLYWKNMCCAKELQFGPQSPTALFPLAQRVSLLSSGACIFSCISIPEAFFFSRWYQHFVAVPCMMKEIILSFTYLIPLQTREIFEQPFQLQLGSSLVLGRQNVLWNFRSCSHGVSFTFQRHEQIWTKQIGAEVYEDHQQI